MLWTWLIVAILTLLLLANPKVRSGLSLLGRLLMCALGALYLTLTERKQTQG